MHQSRGSGRQFVEPQKPEEEEEEPGEKTQPVFGGLDPISSSDSGAEGRDPTESSDPDRRQVYTGSRTRSRRVWHHLSLYGQGDERNPGL